MWIFSRQFDLICLKTMVIITALLLVNDAISHVMGWAHIFSGTEAMLACKIIYIMLLEIGKG